MKEREREIKWCKWRILNCLRLKLLLCHYYSIIHRWRGISIRKKTRKLRIRIIIVIVKVSSGRFRLDQSINQSINPSDYNQSILANSIQFCVQFNNSLVLLILIDGDYNWNYTNCNWSGREGWRCVERRFYSKFDLFSQIKRNSQIHKLSKNIIIKSNKLYNTNIDL